jgi:hypothetical protein
MASEQTGDEPFNRFLPISIRWDTDTRARQTGKTSIEKAL